MPTQILMLGFNSYGVDSDIPSLSSAKNNFAILRKLLTFKRAGSKAVDDARIYEFLDLDAKTARVKIIKAIDNSRSHKDELLVLIIGHGLNANRSVSEKVEDVFVVPTANAMKESAKEGRSDYCIDVEADLFSYLRKIDAPRSTVILDCCNANAVVKGQDDVTEAEHLDMEPVKLTAGTKMAGRRFAIVAASGTGQSAWESSWSEVSPCRKGLRKVYERLELTGEVKITNFVGALVDIWGLSNIQLPSQIVSNVSTHGTDLMFS